MKSNSRRNLVAIIWSSPVFFSHFFWKYEKVEKLRLLISKFLKAKAHSGD